MRRGAAWGGGRGVRARSGVGVRTGGAFPDEAFASERAVDEGEEDEGERSDEEPEPAQEEDAGDEEPECEADGHGCGGGESSFVGEASERVDGDELELGRGDEHADLRGEECEEDRGVRREGEVGVRACWEEGEGGCECDERERAEHGDGEGEGGALGECAGARWPRVNEERCGDPEDGGDDGERGAGAGEDEGDERCREREHEGHGVACVSLRECAERVGELIGRAGREGEAEGWVAALGAGVFGREEVFADGAVFAADEDGAGGGQGARGLGACGESLWR